MRRRILVGAAAAVLTAGAVGAGVVVLAGGSSRQALPTAAEVSAAMTPASTAPALPPYAPTGCDSSCLTPSAVAAGVSVPTVAAPAARAAVISAVAQATVPAPLAVKAPARLTAAASPAVTVPTPIAPRYDPYTGTPGSCSQAVNYAGYLDGGGNPVSDAGPAGLIYTGKLCHSLPELAAVFANLNFPDPAAQAATTAFEVCHIAKPGAPSSLPFDLCP